MSNGFIGYGSTFTCDGNAIAEVKEIKGPGIKIDSVDFSSNDSPNGAREFKPGLLDGGEVSVTCDYTAAGYSALFATKRQSKTWAVTSSAWNFSFDGFLTSLD